MSRKSGIDTAWEILFARHEIPHRVAEDGVFTITAQEINTVKEARLMAKFDRSAQLPQVFRQHRLSILPISRGEYAIGPFETHRSVTYADVRPRTVQRPDLESLDSADLYSEASALLFCFNSGIIGDIMGSSRVHFTVNGRMSSGCFDFQIQDTRTPALTHRIAVQNAQLEVDAGYESPEAFCVCEAKNMASEELLVRQLYYPYRLWRSKIKKPVVPLFLVSSNDMFHAFRYAFDQEDHYNSLNLISHTAYTFGDWGVSLEDVLTLWRGQAPGPEPNQPFPQADSFARVVDLLSILYGRALLRDEVTLKYEFDVRQTDYYITACQYLGLVERVHGEESVCLRLTPEARRFMSRPPREKYLGLMGCILRRPVFHRAFGLALRVGGVPNSNAVVRVMLEAGLGMSEATLARRASTVRGWISWMFLQCGENEQLSF